MLLPLIILLASCILIPLTIRCLSGNLRAEKTPANAPDSGRLLPPGPRGLPILGYLPFIGPNLHQDFMNLALHYGPIFKLSLGRKLCVIVSSPALAKQIVRDHDVTFANRNPNVAAGVFSYGGRDIAFSPYGAEWRLLRKIFVHKMQSKQSMDSFYPLRRKEVRKMVAELYNGGGGGGGEVDVGRVAFTTVIGMISGMFWGGTLGNGDGDDDVAKVVGGEFRSTASKLVEVLGRPNVSDFFPILARFDLQGVKKEMKRVSGGMEKIFDFVIDRCIDDMMNKPRSDDDHNGQQDFLHSLLEFKDQDTGNSITRQQIKAMLMDIVIGGTDTSSTTIEWAMSELIQHPEVKKIAQQELTRVIGPDSVMEESHIPNLPFLHAIVKETLRLHPVAPLLLPRCPTKGCHVGGHFIPEGTKVFLNVWAMHRDPEFWEDPTSFLPERFLNENDEQSTRSLDYLGGSFHYLPFGSGRRICAGLPLGERMVMYVLATLLHMFDWELPEGVVADTKEKFGVVLEKVNPLVLVSSPRLPNLSLYK
ncbi:unnamed protein product [Linum tenue]|uniref:Uncharacterized protein n=1 Tax=Linum tenue TaxID=586396 RepID=A0AAV0JUE7_9ROSI|nr:unnamed protein product [Linum tenue]